METMEGLQHKDETTGSRLISMDNSSNHSNSTRTVSTRSIPPTCSPKHVTDEDNYTTEAETTRRMPRLKQVYQELCRRSVLTFTLSFALCMLTQITLSVFMVTQITSLEREFGFTSFQSGRLLSANEIGFLCFVLPSGYLASRLHVPRSIAISAFCIGLTGVMSGLPHFIFHSPPDYLNGSTVSAADIPPALCVTGEEVVGEDRCEVVSKLKNNASLSTDQSGSDAVYSHRAQPVFVYLILFQICRGVMGAPRAPMFVEFIETNTRKTDTGFYMGIMVAITMLGPAIAFLGGGAISKLHVSLQATALTPTHPEWVGAWWLGFLLFGSMAAVAPLLLWCFPRRLTPQPPTDSHRHRPPRPTDTSCKGVLLQAVAELKGFVLSTVTLLMNPVFFFLILSSCLFGFSMNGTYIFLPKYLQSQFQLPAWKANYLMGGAELGMGTSGFFLGGWLTRRLKLSVRGLYKLLISITSLVVLLVLALMFMGCPQPQLVGQPGSTERSDNCSLSCACPDEVFPVCDRESNVNYFSSCHAGCSAFKDGVYMNCSCTASGQVYPGLCTPECSSVYYFSVVFYIMLFFLSLSGPINYLVLVRNVADHQTGQAMGINGFVTGLVGFLIGPMVFGRMIDSVCQHWKTTCGVKGQCSVYNYRLFRIHMHLYSIVAMGAAIVFCFISFLLRQYCVKPEQSQDKEVADKPTVESGDRMSENCEKKLLQEEANATDDDSNRNEDRAVLPVLREDPEEEANATDDDSNRNEDRAVLPVLREDPEEEANATDDDSNRNEDRAVLPVLREDPEETGLETGLRCPEGNSVEMQSIARTVWGEKDEGERATSDMVDTGDTGAEESGGTVQETSDLGGGRAEEVK